MPITTTQKNRIPSLFLLTLFSVSSIHAANIANFSVINNSSSNENTTSTRGVIREFYTQSTLSPVSNLGDVYSFEHRMQIYNGFQIPTGSGFTAATHSRKASYDLFFTIEDADNRGYTLNIDSVMRGYSTALYTAGGTNQLATSINGPHLSGRIDTDTSDSTDTLNTEVPSMTIQSSGTIANSGISFSHVATNNSLNYDGGNFVGTRSFGLRFTTEYSGNTNVFMQNNYEGQGSYRFGGSNVNAALDITGDPQSGDLFDDSELGQFVTVSASFTVPEPTGVLFLFLAGSLSLLIRQR